MARYMINNLPEKIDFNENDPVRRTIQNAKNLLMCRMGEVPYDRYRGFDNGIYELPLQEFKNELMPELDRVMMEEPDAEVVDAEIMQYEDDKYYLQVTIEIKIGEENNG